MPEKATSVSQEQFRNFVLRSVSIPIAVSITLCGAFVYLILHLMSVNHLVDHSNRVVSQGHELHQLCVDAETGVRGFMITGDESFLDPYRRTISVIDQKIADLIELTSDNQIQSGRIIEIRQRFTEWNKYGSTKIEKKRLGQNYEKELPSMEGKRLMDEIRMRFERFIKTEEFLRDQRSEKTVNTVTFALYAILIGSFIAGTFLALYTRRQLMSLSNVYSSALKIQAEQNLELEEQDWLTSGQAEMAYQLRGDQSVETIAENILRYLIQRLGAKVGAIYNKEQLSLRRVASYAFDPSSEAKNHVFQLGDSLVGQVAIDGQPSILKDLPDDYIKITSGTGSTGPKHIVLYPFISDGQVKGVIELGFLNEVAERDLEYLSLVSESIAIAIKSAEYRALLANLLEQSQRQTEELQAQQEELRSTNEELEEQSNALKESQVRLENQQAELEQTNSHLSRQSKELELQSAAVNEKNDELTQTQAILEQKAKELELSSQYKSQFLANMSHELRTPLNSTLILAQLLVENKRQRLGEEEIEFAKIILSSSNNLLTLINDILDLSKVEAGKIDLNHETINVKDIAEGMQKLFNPIAENKNIEFNIEISQKLSPTFVSDRMRIEQIIKNLLSNAIKFTSKGSVTLKVSPAADGSKRIDFSIIDTGIGISKDQQEVIFDAFKQADGTTSRKYGGTGLGLTISRDLARLLGGEIIVSSNVGEGSNFTLRIKADPGQAHVTDTTKQVPVPEVTKTQLPIVTKYQLQPPPFEDDRDKLNKKLQILLVIEDDTNFAKILYDLSHEMNFNCIVTQKADEGIEAAKEFLPHAIILDMNLPDHSGLTVLDRLKMDPKTRHIPIHIISVEDQAETALQMGALGYLLKPVALDKVKDAIRKMEQKSTKGTKSVLVIEDDKIQRDSIRELIKDDKVEVVTVESAGDALKHLKEKEYDCVILDLHLPDMSGFDLLEEMTNKNIISRPPVIIYTGKDISRAEEERLQKYSQSIILKGAHSPERLLSEVSLFLHQVENNMSKDRQNMLQELRNREKIFEAKKILVVDDDVRNIFALSSALESKGAKVETARNGLEAVKKIKADSEIALVLMDIMMPEMDGYEAMREIRKDSRFAKLPIIAVTAKAMADDQEKCREAGANDYLAKPIDLQKLLSLLRVWMPQKKRI